MNLSPAERRAGITIAIACVSAAALALGLTIPLLGILLEVQGWSRFHIGINSAISPIAIAIASPFMPAIVARFGAKRVILTAALADALLIILIKLTNDFYAWIPLRVLMGFSVSALFVTSESWINEVTEDHNRGKVMAAYNFHAFAGVRVRSGCDSAGRYAGLGTVRCRCCRDVRRGYSNGADTGRQPGIRRRIEFQCAAVFPDRAQSCGGDDCVCNDRERVGCLAFDLWHPQRTGRSGRGSAAERSCLWRDGARVPCRMAGRSHEQDEVAGDSGRNGHGPVRADPLQYRPRDLGPAVLFVWGAAASSIYTVAMALQGERFKGADLVTANAAFGTIYGLGAFVGPMVIGASMDYDDPDGYAWAVLAISAGFLLFLAVRQSWKRMGARG